MFWVFHWLAKHIQWQPIIKYKTTFTVIYHVLYYTELASLKETLEERDKEIEERDKEIEERDKEIMRMREEIKALQQGIVKMESTICLLWL